MCWSGEASAVLATVGIGSTIYVAIKGEDKALWMTLGYFSLMEVLQAFTYLVIDQCGSPANQIATLLGYLHITFQPFFINMISMYFIPDVIRRIIQPYVYTACGIFAIVMLIQLYPFDWAGSCDALRPLCGPQLCSVSGDWHIAWEVPTNGIGNWWVNVPLLGTGFIAYAFAGIMLPILYGSWRMTAYHYMMGPLLASQLTTNVNEWPAVWCLLSIGLLLIVVKTPIRGWLFVRSWPLWPKAVPTGFLSRLFGSPPESFYSSEKVEIDIVRSVTPDINNELKGDRIIACREYMKLVDAELDKL